MSYSERQDWVDVGKGLSIILVVFGHSQGWFIAKGMLTSNAFYEAVHFFRMPFFFFLSGLFCHKVIRDGDGRFYGMRIANLIYLFLVWTIIRIGMDAAFAGATLEKAALTFAKAFTQPLPGLWFIYTLAVFYTVTRLLKNVEATYLIGAAAIVAATIAGTSYIEPEHSTGIEIVDKWGMYYLFFIAGHLTFPRMFKMSQIYRDKWLVLSIVCFCACFYALPITNGVAIILIASLGIWMCSLACYRAASTWVGGRLQELGKFSLQIYLAHIFVISIGRQGLMMAHLMDAPALANAALIIAGIVLPIIGYKIFSRIRLEWLFAIPAKASEKLERVITSLQLTRPARAQVG